MPRPSARIASPASSVTIRPLFPASQRGENLPKDGVFIRLQKPQATRWPLTNGQRKWRNCTGCAARAKQTGGAWRGVFCLFLDRTGGNGILRRCRSLIRLVFFPVATHIDGYRRNDNDAFNNILHIGIDADKGKTAFNQAKDHRANQGAGNAPHSAH